MPNWCNNSVQISGPRDKIKALWEAAQKPEDQGGGLLQAMHPMPEFETEGDDAVMPNWWNWRVSNWGTKWDITTEGLEYTEDGDTATITGWFDSAWAPPVNAFQVYCNENDDIEARLSYHEPGLVFVGVWTSEHGDDYHEYGEFSSDTVRDAIGAELDDEWNISEQLAQYEAEEDSED
jgi:hypothetical protein